MAKYVATLLRVEQNCNPEEAVVHFEEDGADKAKRHAANLIKGDNVHGLGWLSWGDPALWGKPLRKVLAVETEEDHEARVGTRTAPKWTQAEHLAWVREQAKGN